MSPCISSVLPSVEDLRLSGGQPSVDGLRELAASRWNSTAVTNRLVVSYTTFSPLPFRAVVFFSHIQLSPTASIFRSGAPCAARTFLSFLLSEKPATGRGSAFSVAKVQRKNGTTKEKQCFLSIEHVVDFLYLVIVEPLAQLFTGTVFDRRVDIRPHHLQDIEQNSQIIG